MDRREPRRTGFVAAIGSPRRRVAANAECRAHDMGARDDSLLIDKEANAHGDVHIIATDDADDRSLMDSRFAHIPTRPLFTRQWTYPRRGCPGFAKAFIVF